MKMIIKKALAAALLLAAGMQMAQAASKAACINWDPSDFTPVANAQTGIIAPDYGLYWVKTAQGQYPEQEVKAYTPANLEPYFSNGQQNTAPNPGTPGYVAAKTAYQATLTKDGYFNPSAPTIIFIHGWSPGETKSKNRFDFCYQYKTSENTYSQQYNTMQYFKDKGWNVGIFYWNQFADETYIPTVESKIYPDVIGSRSWVYLDKNGDLKTCSNTLSKNCMALPKNTWGKQDSVSELAFAAYSNALPANYKQNIRIAGFSLGSQVAIQLTKQIADHSNLPQVSRLVLLDPYFSKTTPMGLSQSVPEISYESLKHIESVYKKENHPFAISMYRTSVLSTVAYNKLVLGNHDVSKSIAYERLYPKYLNTISAKAELLLEQHVSAPQLYFQSMRQAPSPDVCGVGTHCYSDNYVNAASDDANVAKMGGTKRFQIPNADKTSEYDFADTQDDVFTNTPFTQKNQ